MKASTAWVLAIGVTVLHGVFAAVTWSELPDKIPTHFNLAGQPDAWAAPSLLVWFVPVIATAFTLLVVYAVTRPSAQKLWNIPYKERFLKLTEPDRRPVVELVQAYSGAIVAIVGAVFLSMHWGMYLTALGKANGLPWYVLAFMYAVPAVILIGLVPWSRAVKSAIGRA